MDDISDRLFENYVKYGEYYALVVDKRRWTYSELLGAAIALSQIIRGDGPVAILTNKPFAAYTAIFAAIFAGVPYVILNTSFPESRILSILDASQARAVITDLHFRHLLSNPRALPLQLIETKLVETLPVSNYRPKTLPWELPAYLMFTSGTTGAPKGVQISRGNLAAYLGNIESVAPIGLGDHCTQIPDLSFDLSVHDVFATILQGGCLYVMSKHDRLNPIEFVNRHKINCWVSVPSVAIFASKLGSLTANAMPSLRLCLFCGEPMPPQTAEQWAKAAPNCDLWNLYGPTEATVAVTAFRYDRGADYSELAALPLGHPLNGQTLRIQRREDHEWGELELSGSQVASGYLGSDERRSSEKFHWDAGRLWYRTGDLVKYDALWGYIFGGRLDHQVKIGGYRVEILEIEKAIRDVAECIETAVIPDPILENGIALGVKAFVCLPQRDSEFIIKELHQRLPDYMIPHTITEVDRLPYTPNGKIDRAALLALK